MSRITEIEIAGKSYPLNFSTKAAKVLAKRYGGLENIANAFAGRPADEALDELIQILVLLIDQGVAYRRIAEGVEAQGIGPEELEVLLGVSEYGRVKDTLLAAMSTGMSREIETVPDPKNADATPGP